MSYDILGAICPIFFINHNYSKTKVYKNLRIREMLILKLSLMKNFKNSSLRKRIEINNPILERKLSKDKNNTYPRGKVIYQGL